MVRFARRPYPRRHRTGTWLVVGRDQTKRRLRVVYLIDPDGTYFIIHAGPVS